MDDREAIPNARHMNVARRVQICIGVRRRDRAPCDTATDSVRGRHMPTERLDALRRVSYIPSSQLFYKWEQWFLQLPFRHSHAAPYIKSVWTPKSFLRHVYHNATSRSAVDWLRERRYSLC